MRKSRFTEAQIMGILLRLKVVWLWLKCAVSMQSAARRFTNGDQNTAAWMRR